MAFINMQNVGLAFGGIRLFEEINLTIEQGEKVALVGRNGAGKSTLLKLIQGTFRPDSGTIAIQKGIRSAYLDQMVPGEIPGTVLEVVKGDLSRVKDALEIEAGWEFHHQAEKVISQSGLDTNGVFNTLSAGLKRQVLLAKALVGEPDILLLDEPTNHMDIDSIKRLECCWSTIWSVVNWSGKMSVYERTDIDHERTNQVVHHEWGAGTAVECWGGGTTPRGE